MPIVNAASEDTARRSAVPSLKPDKKSRNVRFSFFRFSMRSDSRILRDRGLSEAKRREKAKRRPRQERRPIPSGIFLVSSAAAIPPSAKNSVSPPGRRDQRDSERICKKRHGFDREHRAKQSGRECGEKSADPAGDDFSVAPLMQFFTRTLKKAADRGGCPAIGGILKVLHFSCSFFVVSFDFTRRAPKGLSLCARPKSGFFQGA